MEINIGTFEAMIILLYKIEEHEACTAFLEVYKKIKEQEMTDLH